MQILRNSFFDFIYMYHLNIITIFMICYFTVTLFVLAKIMLIFNIKYLTRVWENVFNDYSYFANDLKSCNVVKQFYLGKKYGTSFSECYYWLDTPPQYSSLVTRFFDMISSGISMGLLYIGLAGFFYTITQVKLRKFSFLLVFIVVFLMNYYFSIILLVYPTITTVLVHSTSYNIIFCFFLIFLIIITSVLLALAIIDARFIDINAEDKLDIYLDYLVFFFKSFFFLLMWLYLYIYFSFSWIIFIIMCFHIFITFVRFIVQLRIFDNNKLD